MWAMVVARSSPVLSMTSAWPVTVTVRSEFQSSASKTRLAVSILATDSSPLFRLTVTAPVGSLVSTTL